MDGSAGKKKSQKLKLNFPLADLPGLMYKAVRFTQLWNKYKQDAERYVFRTHDPEAVRSLVQHLIDTHCGELRKYVEHNDVVRSLAAYWLHCLAVGSTYEFAPLQKPDIGQYRYSSFYRLCMA